MIDGCSTWRSTHFSTSTSVVFLFRFTLSLSTTLSAYRSCVARIVTAMICE